MNQAVIYLTVSATVPSYSRISTLCGVLALAFSALAPAAYGQNDSSIRSLQDKALKQTQSEKIFIAQHDKMQADLQQEVHSYIRNVLSELVSRGVRFDSATRAMNQYLENDRQNGLGLGQVSYDDRRHVIGVANDHVFYLVPSGLRGSVEIKGDMYWDTAEAPCEFWLDFSTMPSGYDQSYQATCLDFLQGKSQDGFQDTLERVIKAGLAEPGDTLNQ